MHQTITSLLSDLNQNEEIYFRISSENQDAFYEDCRSAGIVKFLNRKPFNKEDVRGLMGIRSDRTIGYVSPLCFSAAAAGDMAVDENGNEEKIILIDYDRLLKGEDEIIHSDPDAMNQNRKLSGRIITIGNH